MAIRAVVAAGKPWAALAFLLCAGGLARAQNATAVPAAKPGSSAPPGIYTLPMSIPELHVKDKTYYNVLVREVSTVSIFITHRGGVGTIPLADLPADLQQRFGYDPVKVAAESARREAQTEAARIQAGVAPGDRGSPMVPTEMILRRFGTPPVIFPEVNMRPRFESLGIETKNQGARPSCVVFAIVSALEYQRAARQGRAVPLSEEYLIWATLKTLGRSGFSLPKEETIGFDLGYSLTEVSQALRAYGIALEDEVPYRFGTGQPKMIELSTDIIERAKTRSPVDGYYVTGRDPKAMISNIVQVLNAGVPVIIGLKWPEEKLLPAGELDTQPGRDKFDHAVLLAGYRCKTGKIEDAEFLFKNSYGKKWGDQGYGLVTYRYLEKNLEVALFLEVRPGP